MECGRLNSSRTLTSGGAALLQRISLTAVSLALGREAQLSRADIHKVVEFYRCPDGNVTYKEFCDMMENGKSLWLKRVNAMCLCLLIASSTSNKILYPSYGAITDHSQSAQDVCCILCERSHIM